MVAAVAPFHEAGRGVGGRGPDGRMRGLQGHRPDRYLVEIVMAAVVAEGTLLPGLENDFETLQHALLALLPRYVHGVVVVTHEAAAEAELQAPARDLVDHRVGLG